MRRVELCIRILNINYLPNLCFAKWTRLRVCFTFLSFFSLSFTDNDLLFGNVNDTVKQLAKRCYDWGYGYLVCSPQDLDLISDIKIKKICPGVRPEWYTTSDDQKRTMTPSEAISKGADYLVIGRPILESNDMISAVP